MKIKWLGHSCFLITSESGLKILIDPFETGRYLSYKPVTESPDIVTNSHLHPDHGFTALQGHPQIIRGPGRRQVKGIEIEGIGCYHDKVQGKERGENTVFCFNVDGMRICHCGDLGHTLDDAALKAVGKVDILMIPTGGPPPTLELKEAVELWQKLKPAVVIAMHFQNDKCALPVLTSDDLVRAVPETIRLGKTEVEYQKDNLPQSQTIIIMDHEL